MRELYLLRHAKTKIAESGQSDRDRALAPCGRRASPRIGAHMAKEGMSPDLVLCSTALRTRETLELVLGALPSKPEVLYEEGLYLAEAEALLQSLSELPETAQRVLLVGHNPGIHELAHHLARRTQGEAAQRLASQFPTGALTRYAIEGAWADLDRTSLLVSFTIPDDLE